MAPAPTLALLLTGSDIVRNNYRLMKLSFISRVRTSVKRSVTIPVLLGIIKITIFPKCFCAFLALKLSAVH